MSRSAARRRLAGLAAGVLLAASSAAVEAGEGTPSLRSELYPVDWQPATPDGEGRFLHDFSYAGYRYGSDPPRTVDGPVVDVTRPPYEADPTGGDDATAAIQAAIDDVGADGGGTVHLPTGTYRVEPPDDSRAVLHIPADDVLLRGDGAGRTRVYNATAEDMRQTAVVLIGPDRSDWHSWHDVEDGSDVVVPLTEDVTGPARTLHVEDVSPFGPGDWVVLKADTTEEWLAAHPVAEDQRWQPETLDALVYHRRITAVDAAAGTVTIDIPTRYPILVRDGARLHPAPDPVTGSGVADLTIGMRQSDLPRSDDDEDDHDRDGTQGHQAHQASAIAFNDAVDGWVSGVSSFRPAANDDDVHLLSVGVYVRYARNITIAGTDLRHPQYRGAGGNGYLYHLMGSDTLVRDARAEGGRHNYLVQAVQATGNVLLDSLAVDGERATELHRHLSAANLFDNVRVDGDTLEMRYRTASTHAHSATESVMWNVSGENCTRDRLAISQQLGWGYVVGTTGRGDCAVVENPGGDGTEPRDWLEHIGDGERLEPRSLYLDQLDRRTARGEVPFGPVTEVPSEVPTTATTAAPGPLLEGGDAWAPTLVAAGVLLLGAAGAGAVALVRRRRQ
ncbi:glycosyl hydrolase family 28-related protein [Georgenia sp. MJ170]|uniref:glycosyl hydrolase family 28-related protein n=1 Tax=Georgenia sunbinii TaxID=3117728 RepID=UPI002F260AB6